MRLPVRAFIIINGPPSQPTKRSYQSNLHRRLYFISIAWPNKEGYDG